MNKSKLGISTCMTAGLVFLLAIIVEFVSTSWLFVLPFVMLVAFILYKEEDLWLKASTLKAVLIVLLFTLVNFFFGFVFDLFAFINFFLQWIPFAITDSIGLISWFKTIIFVFEKVFLLILAIMAFKGKTIKLPLIDGMIAKHIN
jgi:hypothetical protein